MQSQTAGVLTDSGGLALQTALRMTKLTARSAAAADAAGCWLLLLGGELFNAAWDKRLQGSMPRDDPPPSAASVGSSSSAQAKETISLANLVLKVLSFTFVSKDLRARSLSQNAWQAFADALLRAEKFHKQLPLVVNPVKAELSNRETLLGPPPPKSGGTPGPHQQPSPSPGLAVASPRSGSPLPGSAAADAAVGAAEAVQEHKRAAIANWGHALRISGAKLFDNIPRLVPPAIAAVASLADLCPPKHTSLSAKETAAADRILSAVLDELRAVLEERVVSADLSAEGSVDVSAPATASALGIILKELTGEKARRLSSCAT